MGWKMRQILIWKGANLGSWACEKARPSLEKRGPVFCCCMFLLVSKFVQGLDLLSTVISLISLCSIELEKVILTKLSFSLGGEVLESFLFFLDRYSIVGKPAVDNIMRGFNATIFAYGQTGSGKFRGSHLPIVGLCSWVLNKAHLTPALVYFQLRCTCSFPDWEAKKSYANIY